MKYATCSVIQEHIKVKKSQLWGQDGIPSIGIYSYELYNFFDVETIIRVGSCGALQEDVNLYDVIIAQAASTNSNYVDQFNIPGHFAPIADFDLITKAKSSRRNWCYFTCGKCIII